MKNLNINLSRKKTSKKHVHTNGGNMKQLPQMIPKTHRKNV